MYEDRPKAEMALSPREESTRERMERTKQHLVGKIKEIDRILELLAKNPEMEELQDLLRKI